MINKANELLLELRARLQNFQDERGQTSSEYVAVTAVAVAIAIGVIYGTLQTELSAAVQSIGDAITNFISEELPPPEA